MIHSSTDTVYVSPCHGNKTPEMTTEKEERFMILTLGGFTTRPLTPFLLDLVRQAGYYDGSSRQREPSPHGQSE